MTDLYKNYIKNAVDLGTQNLPLSEQPTIRLVNAIGLLGGLTVLITEIMLILFMGFEPASLMMSLFYLILFPSLLFLNYRRQWEWSKRLLLICSICVAITLHFSFPREVASWVFSICVFVLFAAIFKKRRQIILFSMVIIALSIGSIVLQNSPDYHPVTEYSGDDVMGIQIIVFICSSLFVLLGVLFVRSNLLYHQKKLEKVLEERNTLLKEIHHRVKNNLQVIASLLYLQSEKSENLNVKRILEEGQGRVRSMALIHQKLYENEDLNSIPFDEYLTELITEVQNSFGERSRNIKLEIDANGIHLDLDTAIPLGLIINELSTNAFKYAFPNRPDGELKVNLSKQNNNTYLMKISDDGVGIPDDKLDTSDSATLGLRLTKILSDQLEGEYRFSNTQGTAFTLKFAV